MSPADSSVGRAPAPERTTEERMVDAAMRARWPDAPTPIPPDEVWGPRTVHTRDWLRAALRAVPETREARQVVNEQAEDEGLWFDATTATEAYLQAALRRLHAAVERASGGETGPLSVRAALAGSASPAPTREPETPSERAFHAALNVMWPEPKNIGEVTTGVRVEALKMAVEAAYAVDDVRPAARNSDQAREAERSRKHARAALVAYVHDTYGELTREFHRLLSDFEWAQSRALTVSLAAPRQGETTR